MEEQQARELIERIGIGNLMAISGFRVRYETDENNVVTGVVLPVGKGYRVHISIADDGTYTVCRQFVRKGNVYGNWVLEEVPPHLVGEIAYKASCFVNVDFPPQYENGRLIA